MSEKRDFFSKVGQVGSITLISRILGLVREMARAHFLGTSLYSDAFSLAFSLPNLFRRLTAEGAMSNAFIPVYCEIKEKDSHERALEFAKNFFWGLSLILVCLVGLFIWQAPFLVSEIFARGYSGETLEVTVFLSRLMFGYVLLISLSAVAQGVLNSEGVFSIPAFTPVLLNLSIIAAAFSLGSTFANPAIAFAVGVIFGGFLQLFFQFPALKRQGFRLFSNANKRGINLGDPKIKEALKLLVPTLFGAGVYQINIIVSNLIATTLKQGSLSSLTFSNRLLELVLGVLVVSLATVMLPKLAGFFSTGDVERASAMIKQNIEVILFVTLPVIAITLVMAEEIVALLFLRGSFDLHSLEMTAGALRFHILGLVFIGINRIFLASYQANKMISLTAWIAFGVMVANVVLALYLSSFMSHLGIALASSLAQAMQMLALLLFLGRLGVRGSLPFLTSLRILAFSTLLFLELWFLKKYLNTELELSYFVQFFVLFFAIFPALILPVLLAAQKEVKFLKNYLKNRGKA
ncbi:MAG: murein biosynthesis integral membrane protein MurJ [SAR324 cluster bacterium]|nr:murein biosynthesis integral membrane protein MurJ [SAR324 cluster bacterium]